ncbi:homoserine kinase [Nocardioides salsibiostraticola]
MTGVDFVPGPVRVTVPATSANLGPGFDSLGLALDLRDEHEAQVLASGLVVEVGGEGEGQVPLDESHLVVQAMRLAFEAMGAEPSGLRLTCRNVIPHARGLGSSSAAIVAGLGLARALVVDGKSRLDDDALFALAAGIEGHPDNVAPAVYGGFVVCGRDSEGYYAVDSPVDQSIGAVAFIPPHGLSTEAARGLLPATVPHADAAADAGRSALLVRALAGATEQLWRGTADYLHQEYRRVAMPETLTLIDELRADRVAAFVSGAGPTVLAFHTDSAGAPSLLDRAPLGWRAVALTLDTTGLRVG